MRSGLLDFYRGKRVFVTGHTGFKGAWLCLLLAGAGAKVTGYALDPPTEPSLYHIAAVREGMDSRRGDVRDYPALAASFRRRNRRSCSIWPPSRWCWRAIASRWIPFRSIFSERLICWNVFGRFPVFVLCSTSPRIRCTGRGKRMPAAGRRSRWGGGIPIPHPKPVRSW